MPTKHIQCIHLYTYQGPVLAEAADCLLAPVRWRGLYPGVPLAWGVRHSSAYWGRKGLNLNPVHPKSCTLHFQALRKGYQNLWAM